ncbi:unnamed protein product [Pleuronectes platessa]|uniref:Uncharacterized protein n=1 Tax=Pleuronectes platessa TaxID=8262 RepID=A0A9N7ULS0_PLEPL|nr:unnamed protein product [Pleuronectes platessa]
MEMMTGAKPPLAGTISPGSSSSTPRLGKRGMEQAWPGSTLGILVEICWSSWTRANSLTPEALSATRFPELNPFYVHVTALVRPSGALQGLPPTTVNVSTRASSPVRDGPQQSHD